MKIIFVAGAYIGDGTPGAIERNVRKAEEYAIALADKEIGFFALIYIQNILVAVKNPMLRKNFITI